MLMLATAIEQLSDDQIERFHRDGFLIIEEGFISDRAIELLRERFDLLFAGEYATGIQPDEVNWKPGRDSEDLTRQICNGWRADDVIAAQVLSERTGRIAARRFRMARLAGSQPTECSAPRVRQLGVHGNLAGSSLPARCDVRRGRGQLRVVLGSRGQGGALPHR